MCNITGIVSRDAPNKIKYLVIFGEFIGILMFFGAMVSFGIYNSQKSKSNTYDTNCIQQYNYTCGFCKEASGDYYKCENGLMVITNGPDYDLFVLGMCLLTVNPLSFTILAIIYILIRDRKTRGNEIKIEPKDLSANNPNLLSEIKTQTDI